jgi:AcrR family transcriptional regulator
MKSSRVRGRPRTFDRNQALLAAVRVFRERGYDGATLADLQEAMGGISPPSLYAAFGSKEQLFMEAVTAYAASTGKAGRCALEAPAISTREAIEQVLRANVTEITKPGEPSGCMLVLGALNGTSEAAAACAHLQDLRSEAGRSIARRIKRGVREGDVPRGTDVESLAAFVTAFMHGLSIQARDGASRAVLNAAVDRAMLAWDANVGGGAKSR